MSKHLAPNMQSPSTIFVFGSDTAGRHGAGAALYAKLHYQANYGQGEGLQGQNYAIPTKDGNLQPLPVSQISKAVQRFKNFARSNPQLSFFVTRIGCGLAGFRDEHIAPLFANTFHNCKLPQGWRALNGEIENRRHTSQTLATKERSR